MISDKKYVFLGSEEMKLMFHTRILGGGGAERVLVNLANDFTKKTGNEVVLVAMHPIKNEYEISENVRVKYLFPKRYEGSVLKRDFYWVRRLRRIINEENPDAVLAFLPIPCLSVLVSSIGQKCKIVLSVRSDPKFEYPNFILRVLAKTLYRFADTVVFQTQEQREFFPKKVQKKSVIIMNQVKEKFFQTDIVNCRKNIVTTGRLLEEKNQKMLIEAFAKISDKITDNLIIYGEGKLRKELEDIVKEKDLIGRVFLPGHTQDVIGSIKGAKMFVLSSDCEGMPNALLEAMALGIPCISTDCPCGGPREIITNGENGFLVPVNDADSLAEKMLELINNEELQNKFSKEARESATKFKPDKIFCEWEKVLLNC